MSAISSRQERSCLVCSPAKINLFLEVTGRRSDGFHELETVMIRTDLCDTLRFEPRDDASIELTCTGVRNSSRMGVQTACAHSREFPLGESNLIIKAAHALQQRAGGLCGATIRVHKRIPGRAGLGGGSGNAAITLLTLNQLWKMDLSVSSLYEIGSEVGSDVNFLLSGYRAALCTGRGEKICPVTVNGERTGLLVLPWSGNSTADVFRALELPKKPCGSGNFIKALGGRCGLDVRTHGFNRLQAVAQRLNPDVRRALSWLDARAGGGLMTGSGSACFTLMKSAANARRLARQFQIEGVGLATTFRY